MAIENLSHKTPNTILLIKHKVTTNVHNILNCFSSKSFSPIKYKCVKSKYFPQHPQSKTKIVSISHFMCFVGKFAYKKFFWFLINI